MRGVVSASSSARTPMEHSSPPSPIVPERTPWHSPLPYLFGGLAAMLSLIAFALVILACSYWNLSRHNRERDLEAAGDGTKNDSEKSAKVNYDEKVLVIMAGDQNPTFLATPVFIKVSSAVETTVNGESEEREMVDNRDKTDKDMEMNNHDREVTTNSVTHESGDSQYQ